SDGLGNFSLVDDGDDTTAPFNSMTFDGLTDFHGVSGNTYDFTETVPTGWQVPSIGCSTGANVTIAGSTLTVRLAEDTHVTCTYTNTNVAPTVSITKTPSTATVPEPGATVTYQLRITNTSAEDVTLYEVDDNRFGSQNTVCGVPRTLTAGQTFTCSFDGPVTGDAGDLHTNTATARVRDADGSTAFATAQATVAVTDVLPTITVSKTATPVTLTEPGGRVTFVVVVDNTSVEPVTVDSVTDSVYNDVTSGTNPRIVASTCATGAVVPAGDQSTCSFTVDIAGNAGFTETNRIEVAVHDDDGNSTTATDTATVTVADAKPVVAVDKTASKGAVRNGETVTYTYVVTTAGAESLLDVKVTDDKCSPVTFGTGDADGDGKLDPGESWTYTCATKLTSTTTNTVAVEAEDDEGNAATASDSATVRVVDPRIAVDKSAEPRSATPGDRVLYTYLVTNPGDAELTQVVVSDDKCSPVTFATGDADGDGALDPGETWRYTCTVTVGPDIGSLTNVGTVTAKDPTGGTVSADDRETISIVLGAVIERPRAGAQGALPRTGQDVGALSLAGAALVALGGVLLACAPRRRPAA
ncbi:MAG TPA: LPXTG cell wall anchor domain-containing protein, partial [Acidimicrobiales bacterium]|nr:LPXTG cell wall anchor domain-containing protein [Acidimicrobiales bacterium]